MAYGYPIITYGGGPLLAELFNGIAAAVGTSSYASLLELSAFFGFGWVVIESVFRQRFMMNVHWLMGLFLFYNILLVPKVTVHVEDKVNADQITAVDNVPWGLAAFASLASGVGGGLTDLMEETFSLPDDLRYSESGSVMASSLVTAASQFQITNPQFAQNIQSYMQQCVFYDLLLGKYTVQDLFDSGNIWSTITANPSPARSFRYNNTIMTCQSGAAQLTQDWQTELAQAGLIYGQRLFPNSPSSVQAQDQLLGYLPVTYQYLTGISAQANDLMQQNMLIQAVSNAVIGNGASVGSTPAIQGYAFARAQQIKRSTFEVTQNMAAYWLPIMQNVFEAMLYGGFLLIAPLTFLPIGVSIFKTYLGALCWLQCWSPLYALLNLAMTIYAGSNSLAAVSSSGSSLLTIHTLPGLSQANADTVALAGYLSLSIPMVAYGFLRGSAGALSQLAQYVGGVTQQAAGRAAEEISTGNLSFGNTQFSTQSAFNTSANHFNKNASVEMGLFTQQTPSGGLIYHTPSGTSVIDSRFAISSIGTTVNVADSLRAAASQQSERSLSAGLSQTQAYANAMTSALRSVYELSKTQGTLASNDTTSTVSESGSISNSLSHVQQLTSRFAHDNNLSESQAVKLLAEASAGVGVSVQSPRALVASIGASLNARASIDGMSSAQKTQAFQAAEDFVRQTNFNQALETTVRGLRDQHYRVGNEQAQRLIDNAGSAFDQANTYRQEATSQFQQAASYRDMVSRATEQALSINSNESQAFVNWLQQQRGIGGQGRLGIRGAEYILNNEPELAQTYAQTFAQARVNELMSQWAQGAGTPSAVQSSYSGNNQQIPGSSTVLDTGAQNNSQIQQEARQQGLGGQQGVSSATAQTANQMLTNSNQMLRQGEDLQEWRGHQVEEFARLNSDPNAHDLASRAVENAKEAILHIGSTQDKNFKEN